MVVSCLPQKADLLSKYLDVTIQICYNLYSEILAEHCNAMVAGFSHLISHIVASNASKNSICSITEPEQLLGGLCIHSEGRGWDGKQHSMINKIYGLALHITMNHVHYEDKQTGTL